MDVGKNEDMQLAHSFVCIAITHVTPCFTKRMVTFNKHCLQSHRWANQEMFQSIFYEKWSFISLVKCFDCMFTLLHRNPFVLLPHCNTACKVSCTVRKTILVPSKHVKVLYSLCLVTSVVYIACNGCMPIVVFLYVTDMFPYTFIVHADFPQRG